MEIFSSIRLFGEVIAKQLDGYSVNKINYKFPPVGLNSDFSPFGHA